MLRAQTRLGIPAGIEQHKQRADVMPQSDGEKGVHAFLKTGCILLPQQVVEKNTHGIHAHRLSPGQLLIDLGRIEGCFLPHLQLVDRRSGRVIAAHQPRLFGVPGICLLLAPARGLRVDRGQAQTSRDQSNQHSNAYPFQRSLRLHL